MTDQMNYQAMKLTLLQKKIDNISLAVSDIKNTYSSLEGKINEDKGREFQSFLKGKSKINYSFSWDKQQMTHLSFLTSFWDLCFGLGDTEV